ncbi:MAG: von Willebrand factor type domain [Solirubrobacterales bacterium]|nr:von Willebrand factor type domain [Solirubrobacterales bacterium]
MRSKHLKWLGATPVFAVTAALAMSSGASASPVASASAACTKGTNIEAIVDDSGSMSVTDPNKNRTELLNAFNSIASNKGKFLGAVEFGTSADTLFPPTAMPIADGTLAAAFGLVNADNGSTDYNLAFSTAKAANPNANGRIFLSDGEHNVGTYNDGHLTPNVRTYTVGFGATDPTLLTKIATDTGGQAFNLADSSAVPAVAASITAGFDCKRPPLVFSKVFTKQGQAQGYSFKPLSSTADILVTWPVSIGTNIGTINPKLALPPGVATTAKVKATVKKGKSFVTVHLKGLKKGKKAKFKVKAKSLAGPTPVTTQVIR